MPVRSLSTRSRSPLRFHLPWATQPYRLAATPSSPTTRTHTASHRRGHTPPVLFMTENAQPRETPSQTELVFKRYGSEYVLKNIWVEGSDIGYVTASAEGERHVSKRGDSPGEERVAARKKADTSK